ncbi:MAG: hypothetical protein K2Q09_06875, partial [Phycisphaerales bacterium]|nr:hypothetical protein [Phycisphaerales bacterium]
EGVASRPGAGPVDPRHAAAATLAATDLADDDPRSLDRPLAEALSKGDAALVQIILEGVLRSIHPDAGSLVRQGRFEPRPAGPWPDARAAATALLVAARHGEFTADPAERIARLSAIASAGPGSGISAVLRAQAAWLALRVSGEDRVALTRILNDLSAPPADTPQPGPQPKPPPADAATPAPSRP